MEGAWRPFVAAAGIGIAIFAVGSAIDRRVPSLGLAAFALLMLCALPGAFLWQTSRRLRKVLAELGDARVERDRVDWLAGRDVIAKRGDQSWNVRITAGRAGPLVKIRRI